MDDGNLEERSRRIVESAVALAEEGGFEAVRLRDVAAHANVALGTVYKRFSSKEDILVAALEQEMHVLEKLLSDNRVAGATATERLTRFFDILTRAFLRRPNLARAVLRAMASGDRELTDKVTRYHDRVTKIIVDSVEGDGGGEAPSGLSEDEDVRLAFLLSQIWFAALVGWSSGLSDVAGVVEQMGSASALLVAGFLATR